jgi:hypothetical protein
MSQDAAIATAPAPAPAPAPVPRPRPVRRPVPPIPVEDSDEHTPGAGVGGGAPAPVIEAALREGQYAPLQLEADRDFDDRALAEAHRRIEALSVRRYTQWLVTGYGPCAALAFVALMLLGTQRSASIQPPRAPNAAAFTPLSFACAVCGV